MSENIHFADGIRSGREESPDVEYAFQDEIVRALKELLETKGMYQNVRVDEGIFKNLSPELLKEFKQRPATPHSRGEGDDAVGMRGSMGTQPVGTPQEKMNAGFYLPNINLDCPRCARSTTFLSMMCSERLPFRDPYPIFGDETEQLYSLYYRCAVCRQSYIVFQVLRKGFKLQLTGRSAPFRPTIAKEWPKDIRQIVGDAFSATAENDVPAAYYHLRTAVEFYLKKELGIGAKEKIDGSELCERYNAQIDDRLKSGFPTFGAIYSELSIGLHSREVNPDRFKKLSNDFLAHLRAKELFAEYSVENPA